MSNSLPHAQRLHERFAGDERVRVVAVATAFEKEEYPWMADEAQIRRTLEQKGWTFPVMRDTDAEQIVRTLTLNGRTGTPMTLVVDAAGIVRWHAFNGTDDTARSVDETVERLLESFYVPALPNLDPRLASYAKGNYGPAYKAARRALDDADTAEELKAQAETVLAHLEAGVTRLVEESAGKRERGFPAAAQEKLEAAVKIFRGVPRAADADQALRALKGDAAFRTELKAEKELEKVLTKLAVPDAKRAPLAKKLQKLADTYGETPVGPRIEAARARAE